ncbi:Xaa-Pro peptidase family protein [Aliiglaciecola sp. 2_MG-2023]|uniref:M24 family metallopeptidase n=1 Tax=unclassified Aliiglaciecola TaxID=2593648 RepID=UPI0026E24A32|nr:MULTISPECIES: Xaa-Pro peptidase family protein [unclassified Aliiglaciecola]MDO6712584.1 Xaa-Pro peptidase family protein [Aliiglaciecola sp. 2_MG-2023]MDO6753808.1 Xaa-Pro peptidase family protein [Aliiglaciecola sp. 1_MG-2023]
MQKRTFLKLSSFGMASIAFNGLSLETAASPVTSTKLSKVTGNVQPISVQERKLRIAAAQKHMAEQKIDAIILEPGAAMDYFTGIQWWRSERLTGVVIPQSGDIAVVCPFFEEPSIRESLKLGDDVRVWQEHESPFELIKQVLQDRGIRKGKLGFESTLRYFVLDGVMALLPDMNHVSAEPVTLACRMYKSAHELTLMHKANEVTLMAYEHVFSQLQLGMTQHDVKQLMDATQSQLGGTNIWCLALFNEASAYPHGTGQSQVIKQGSVILMDSGCSVYGYQSDISRTLVFGEASKKQRAVWETVKKGQKIAYETALVGTAAGKVDDAVRAYYEKQGYGPLYKLPGLSHRTGHGIGMEGHESVNFVKGETTPLNKGMCLSNEPGIYIPGEFGVRLEDCLYMGDKQAHWFTEPPKSLDEPLGRLVPLSV